jgi:plastocyanin
MDQVSFRSFEDAAMLRSLFRAPAAPVLGVSRSATRTQRRPARPRSRPGVESLEDRALLATVTVDLLSASFSPPSVTIHVGDTVHWVWDTSDHTVTSYGETVDQFTSPGNTPLNMGTTFDHTFNVAGTFQYRCLVHSFPTGNGTFGGMIGTITVTAANAPTLQSITVTPANPTIGAGSTQAFTATGTFSDNSQQNISNMVTWASSNTGVASITSNGGVATGVSAGTSTITASMNGINGSTNLTVSASSTPTPTPTFVSESRMTTGKGAHKKVIGFNLNFSGPLDPTSATDVTHYQVTQPGATKKAHSKAILVGMAMYTPGSSTVMLMLGKFNTGKPLTLMASGLLGATKAPVAQFTTRL